jgi:hypothetical protein
MRLPTVRNRVARLALRPGEGELHIGMPRKRILRMARRYGTASGKLFVERYTDAPGERASPAWREQRWVRLQALLVGLRGWLKGAASAAASEAHTVAMREAIDDARHGPPLRGDDDGARELSHGEAEQLQALLASIEQLEERFRVNDAPQPYKPMPAPELRLRTPV